MNSIVFTEKDYINNDYEKESSDLGSKYGIDASIHLSEEWLPIEQSFTPNFNINSGIDQALSTRIEFDCEIRAELSEDLLNLNTIPISAQIDPFIGLLDDQNFFDEDPRLSYVFSTDDRELVQSTTSYPWRTICKLYITAADSQKFIGSGAIIDDFHVLTCGHCVYIHDHGGWVDSIEVVPAMYGDYWPFGSSFATYMRTYVGWADYEMPEYDMAVLNLDKSIGSITGWMGRRTEDYSSSIYTGVLNTAGYPGDLYYGEYMYRTSDYGDRADVYNHWYWLDTYGGQSGSPVWTYDGTNRYILTVNAYEYINGADANFGTRLDSAKFNDINTWLSEDAGSPPNDKAELANRGEFTDVSTTEVIAGQSNFQIFYEVENTGTMMATNFDVNFYASEDTYITSSDYLIGVTTIPSLNAYDYTNADWEGIFPSSIPSGDYYIGWIIDEEDTVDEYDENNNVGVINYETINVQEPPFNPMGLIIASVVGLVIVITALLVRSNVRKIPDLDFTYDYSKDFGINHGKRDSYFDKFYVKVENPNFKPKFCTNCGYSFGIDHFKYCPSCGFLIKEDLNQNS